MKLSFTVLVALWVAPAFGQSYEFQNFTVNPKALNGYQKPSLFVPKVPKKEKLGKAQAAAPLPKTSSKLEKSALSNSGLVGIESPLMQEVRQLLGRDFSIIRDEQRQILKEKGDSFNLGVKNYDGLLWQKPMGEYTIYADRQVLPNPDDDRWVVSDQLVIAIHAQTFLREMNEQGIVSIDEAGIGAFAGLQFHRVYQYRYFVDSYDEGINSNYDKLILGFMNFIQPRIDLMQTNEVITKSDSMGFYAGALVDVPLKYGLEFSGGVLAKAEKVSEVELKALSEEDILDTGNFLKVKATQTESKTLGAELGLKLDFFNILKLTLLSFEYHVTEQETKTTHLTFDIHDRIHFQESTSVSNALADLMHFKGVDTVLYDFVDIKQMDYKKEKVKNWRVFNSGNASSTSSLQSSLYIPRDGEKYYMSHESNDLKYTKGWKGALWDMTFQSSIGFDIFNDYKYSRRKTSQLDFERNTEEQNFSSRMTQEFFAYKTHSKKKYKKRAVNFLEDYTYFPRELIALVESGQVRGPMKIKVVMKPHPEAIFYLDAFTKKEAKQLFASICDGKRANRCERRLYKYYRKFKKAKGLQKKLWRVKDLISSVNKYAPSLGQIEQMFGSGGLYISGSIKAKTNQGVDFKSYFEEGQWDGGLSVLDRILYYDLQQAPTAPLLD